MFVSVFSPHSRSTAPPSPTPGPISALSALDFFGREAFTDFPV